MRQWRLSLFGARYHGIATAAGNALIAEARAESQSWTLGIRLLYRHHPNAPAKHLAVVSYKMEW